MKRQNDKLALSSNIAEADKKMHDKISYIRANSDVQLNEKIKKTQEDLKRKEEISAKELAHAAAERERRKSIKGIKNEAFVKNYERAKKAEEFRLKRFNDDLAIKDAKFKALKESKRAFEAFREVLVETCAKSRGEMKRDLFKLHHEEVLNPDLLVDVVMENANEKLFPRLHNTFRPASSGQIHRKNSRDQLPDMPSPPKSPGKKEDPLTQSGPLAHAHFTLRDFVPDRVPQEIAKAKVIRLILYMCCPI